jgi:hypothetical protein
MAGRAARWVMAVLRAAIPLVLLFGGVASVWYGATRHTAEIAMEQEIEIDLALPPGFDPFAPEELGPGDDVLPGVDFGVPGFADPPPWMAPPPELSKVTQTVILNESTSEPILIREVTYGGVKRERSGVLMRTYSGDPPLLCPT